MAATKGRGAPKRARAAQGREWVPTPQAEEDLAFIQKHDKDDEGRERNASSAIRRALSAYRKQLETLD